MNMNKLLLIIATCVLFASSQEVKADNYYAGATGGLNWIQGYHHHDSSLNYKTGYTGVGTVGYRCDCGLRLEGELGYRYNKISKVKFEGERLGLHGNSHSWSMMANVLYNIPVEFCLQPYVGAGIGYAKHHIHVKHAPTESSYKNHTDGFTYQFIAGAEYPLNECLSLDTKYRYQKTNNVNNNQSVELGLVYAF